MTAMEKAGIKKLSIKEKTGFATSTIMASLSLMELKGRVKHMGGDSYQKI